MTLTFEGDSTWNKLRLRLSVTHTTYTGNNKPNSHLKLLRKYTWYFNRWATGSQFYMFSWLLLLLSWYSYCYHNRLLGCCGYNHDTVARKVNLLYLCIPYFFNRNSSLCLSVWHVTFWEICALFKTSFDLKETPKYFFDQIENCRRGKSKSEFYN